MRFAWKEEPLAFWQLVQWQSTLVHGCPVTESVTALQRKEPYRTLEEMLIEGCMEGLGLNESSEGSSNKASGEESA